MNYLQQLLANLESLSFEWDNDSCPDFKIELDFGWLDFKIIDKCPYTVDPTEIVLYDEGADIITLSESQLNEIKYYITNNSKINEIT